MFPYHRHFVYGPIFHVYAGKRYTRHLIIYISPIPAVQKTSKWIQVQWNQCASTPKSPHGYSSGTTEGWSCYGTGLPLRPHTRSCQTSSWRACAGMTMVSIWVLIDSRHKKIVYFDSVLPRSLTDGDRDHITCPSTEWDHRLCYLKEQNYPLLYWKNFEFYDIFPPVDSKPKADKSY